MSREFDPMKLAVSFRRLVIWFGVQLLITVLGQGVLVTLGDTELGLSIAVGMSALGLVAIVALALFAYRTAAALGSKAGVLWALAMLIPYANVVTLLILNYKASRACREAGLHVGLLGPEPRPVTEVAS